MKHKLRNAIVMMIFLSAVLTAVSGIVYADTGDDAVNRSETNAFGEVQNITAEEAGIDLRDAVVTAEHTVLEVGDVARRSNVKPTVTLDGKTLEYNKDYEILVYDVYHGKENGTYYDIDSATRTVLNSTDHIQRLKIKGKGDYTGTADQTIDVTAVERAVTLRNSENTTDDVKLTMPYMGDPETITLKTNYMDTAKDLSIENANEAVAEVTGTRLTSNATYSREYQLTITPKGAGETTIEVYAKAVEKRTKDSNHLTINVTVTPFDLETGASVSGIKPVYEYTGRAISVDPIVKVGSMLLEKNTDYTVTYLIDGEETADAPAGSRRTNTTVTALIRGTNVNYTGVIKKEFTIAPVTLTVEQLLDQYPYDPDGVKPLPVVKHGANELVLNQDYELHYGSNDTIGTGSGSVTVIGIGDYAFAVEQTYSFGIEPASLRDAVVTAEHTVLEVGDVAQRSNVKPTVTLNEKTLEYNKDYEILVYDVYYGKENGTYYDIDSGTRTVLNSTDHIQRLKIEGKGDYTGTADQTIDVTAVERAVTLRNSENTTDDIELTLYMGDPETITLKTDYMDTAKDLSIENANEAVAEVTGTGLTSNATYSREYQLTITPKGAGETTIDVYAKAVEKRTKASNHLKIHVSVKRISFADHVTAEFAPTADIENYFYQKSAYQPEVWAFYDNIRQLEPGTDYVVTYENNTYAGTAKAIISPVDTERYDGSVTLEFTIKRAELPLKLTQQLELEFGKEETVSFEAAPGNTPDVSVSGNAATAVLQDFNVNNGRGTILVRGRDVGDATLHFTQEPDHRYEGKSAEIAVTVTGGQLDPGTEVDVTGIPESVVYTGEPYEPDVTVKGRGITLDADDYEVAYTANIDPGTASVTVKGKKGLIFEKTATFEIVLPDSTPLEQKVKDAKALLGTASASKNGANVLTSEDWVPEDVYQSLEDQIRGTETLLSTDKFTAAKLSAMADALEKTAEAFETAKKPGTSGSGENTGASGTSGSEESTGASGPADPATQTDGDGTALGKGASVKAAEKAILSSSSDEGPAGSTYAVLQLRSTKQTKKSLTLVWKKVSGAKKYVLYGNACGKKNKFKKIGQYTGSKATVKKIAGKAVKKGTYYKLLLVALDGKNNVVSASKVVHVASAGGKVGNVGKITTKARNSKVSIKVRKSFKLAASAVPASKKLKVKKHRGIKYESTNTAVAKVSASGVIKGVKKGTCYVYAYAQNGVAAKIKVVVK